MKNYVVLVAGGSGNRMQSGVPKQFLAFGGKPMLMHTIDRFYNFDNHIHIILVLPDNSINVWEKLVQEHHLACPVEVIAGGKTRSDSTRAGLSLVPENALVAIHDAVRPLISRGLIKRCYETAFKFGNSCPAIRAIDSLRKQEGDHTKSMNRSEYFQVQTPQCFHAKLIKEAFNKTTDNSFTDEISLFESMGHEIHLVEGDRWNIKITYPEDLLVAEALFSKL